MNKITKRIFSLVLCVMCMMVCTIPVFADIVDTSKTGSIGVTIHAYGSEDAVGGGSLDLYKIADVVDDDSYVYTYAYTPSFEGCDTLLLTQDKLNLASTAEIFATYVSNQNISAVSSKEVSSNGNASFDGLSLGLYMIVQTTAASGYEAFNPFLVTVPVLEEGVYVYDVNATPKTQGVRTKETTSSEPKSEPDNTKNKGTTQTTTPQSTSTPKSDTNVQSTDNSKSASNAKTSDMAPLVGWLCILAAAIAGVIVVIIRRRRAV